MGNEITEEMKKEVLDDIKKKKAMAGKTLLESLNSDEIASFIKDEVDKEKKVLGLICPWKNSMINPLVKCPKCEYFNSIHKRHGFETKMVGRRILVKCNYPRWIEPSTWEKDMED